MSRKRSARSSTCRASRACAFDDPAAGPDARVARKSVSIRRASISSACRRGRPVVVQAPVRPPWHVFVGESAHDDDLFPSARPRDHELVADAQLAMRLGDDAVDGDASEFALPLRFRAGLEQTGDIEPDVEAAMMIDYAENNYQRIARITRIVFALG